MSKTVFKDILKDFETLYESLDEKPILRVRMIIELTKTYKQYKKDKEIFHDVRKYQKVKAG